MPGVSAAFAALLSFPPRDDPARIAAIAEAILPAENATLLPSPAREVFMRRALERVEAAIAASVAARLSPFSQTRRLARALSHAEVRLSERQRARTLASLYALDRRSGAPATDCAASPRLCEAAAALCGAALCAELMARDDCHDADIVTAAFAAAHDAAAAGFDAAAQEVSRAVASVAFRFGFDDACDDSLGAMLEQGRPVEFIFAIAACAGVDPATARRALADRSVEALAVVAAAASLPRAAFARIAFFTHTDDATKIRGIDVLDRYRAIPAPHARAVADCWARSRLRTSPAGAESFSGADMEMAAG